jgi:hypothetical protein
MTKEIEWSKLNDLYQDIIQGLDGDLETGSHHWNNFVWAEHAKKFRHFWEAFSKLGDYIDKFRPEDY